MEKPKLILVAVMLLACGMTVRFAADNRSRASSARELEKKDIEDMMSSLSNWGRWGKEDELGTLNLITAQKRKQGAAEVKEGVSVSLARDMAATGAGGLASFEHKMTSTGVRPESTHASDIYSMEYHGYALTHMDGLCHLFYKGKMYNGFSQEQVTAKGATRLSIIKMKAGLFTRGVLMDMPRLWGDKYLEGGRAIYPEDLEAWEKKAGVRVKSGDAVLIRTGRWARQAAEGEGSIQKNSAGLHASCLPWLKQRDVAIIGSDLATDVLPSSIEGFDFPIHKVAIVAMGMPILDNCDLEALSEVAQARRRWSFLLTAAPLPVEGGTGSPINPIATF